MRSFDPFDQQQVDGVEWEDLYKFTVFLDDLLFLGRILDLLINPGNEIEKLQNKWVSVFESLELHEVLVFKGVVRVYCGMNPFFHDDVGHEVYRVWAVEFHFVTLTREVEPILFKFGLRLNSFPESIERVNVKPFLEVLFYKMIYFFKLSLFFLLHSLFLFLKKFV